MKYKAVLFDMDGVILDSEPIHFAAFQATFKHHGRTFSHEDFLTHFIGRTDEEGFKRYFQFMNEEIDINLVMDQKAKHYLELAKDQLVAYPGVVQLIKHLHNHTKLALVTGSLRIEAEAALEAVGIIDCFEFMVCADDITIGKPDPEGYLKAQSRLGIAKEDCVIIEDTPSGVAAAKASGIRCIAVTNTHSSDTLKEADIITDALRLDLF